MEEYQKENTYYLLSLVDLPSLLISMMISEILLAGSLSFFFLRIVPSCRSIGISLTSLMSSLGYYVDIRLMSFISLSVFVKLKNVQCTTNFTMNLQAKG